MTKEEFIHYTRGIIDSEMEKIRVDAIKIGRQTTDLELTGSLKLIKDALDKVHTTQPTPGYQGPILTNPCIYVNNLPDEVPYSEICPCNPKNGGNGICGCSMPDEMVLNPKKYSGYSTTITSTDIKIN